MYVIVILVISNASLLDLAAMILRSEFGTLNLCILHSDILFVCLFLYLQFAYGFKYNFILVFFFVLLPLFAFFVYQIALYFISHFIVSLIGMS